MIVIILTQLLFIMAVANWYFHSYRNDKAALFFHEILSMASETAERAIKKGVDEWEEPYHVIENLDYYRVIYSFKPFTLETWFTKEEIKILKGEDL